MPLKWKTDDGKEPRSKVYISGAVVKLVAVSAVSAPDVADGRAIPLLLLDLSERRDVAELISIHRNFASGDAVTVWGRDESDPNLEVLAVQFHRPVELEFAIVFDIRSQGGIVDQAMKARAVWIEDGAGVDLAAPEHRASMLMIEIGGQFDQKRWQKRWRKAVRRMLLGKGYKGRRVDELAEAYMRDYSLPTWSSAIKLDH